MAAPYEISVSPRRHESVGTYVGANFFSPLFHFAQNARYDDHDHARPVSFRPCSRTPNERGDDGIRKRKPLLTSRSMFLPSGWGWPQTTLCSLQIFKMLLIASATTECS